MNVKKIHKDKCKAFYLGRKNPCNNRLGTDCLGICCAGKSSSVLLGWTRDSHRPISFPESKGANSNLDCRHQGRAWRSREVTILLCSTFAKS